MATAACGACCWGASPRAWSATLRARCSSCITTSPRRPDPGRRLLLAVATLEGERSDLVVLLGGVIGAGERLLLVGDVGPGRRRWGLLLQVGRPRGKIDVA